MTPEARHIKFTMAVPALTGKNKVDKKHSYAYSEKWHLELFSLVKSKNWQLKCQYFL